MSVVVPNPGNPQRYILDAFRFVEKNHGIVGYRSRGKIWLDVNEIIPAGCQTFVTCSIYHLSPYMSTFGGPGWFRATTMGHGDR